MPEPAHIQRVFRSQQAHAISLRATGAPERIALLTRLRAAIRQHEDDICAAAYKDFSKPRPEARLAELLPVYSEIRQAIRNLKRWMKPRRVRTTLAMLGTQAEIRQEPKGVCLIIAPWNYPFQLAIGPLVSALAAGNTAIIKPSELTPHVSEVIKKIVEATFETHEVAVFEGDQHLAGSLLELPFDHIFFTGSPAVGSIVMAAAAKHLASVTLELGGKSPAVVDASADIEKAARDIMWGKLTNNGQTCIAPDYLHVHESIMEPFLLAARKAVGKAYGEGPEAVKASQDYCRIVDQRHFERIAGLYQDAVEKGATTVMGGVADAAERFFAPTILTDIPADARVLHEEIFGPLLPVLPFSGIDQVIEQINSRPKPLAMYIFGKDQGNIDQLFARTSAGGACVNHNLLHYGHENLPFGGVNHSGIGKAHGQFGFEAFSNQKPVLVDRFSGMHRLYPPYTDKVKKLIDFAIKRLG